MARHLTSDRAELPLTRILEPDAPALKNRVVRSFAFQNLPQIPGSVARLKKNLHRLLPQLNLGAQLQNEVQQTLQQSTKMDIDLWFHSIDIVDRSNLLALVPGKTYLAVIGLNPEPQKLLLEVDLRFVYRAIQQLLGGLAPPANVHRSLSEIEHGVFSYVLLKVLALFQKEFTAHTQLGLTLEDARNDIRSASEILAAEEHWLCASWKMNYDLDVGHVRLLVPHSLAKSPVLRPKPKAGSVAHNRLLQLLRQNFGRIRETTTEVRISIGQIQLARSDLVALDPGDIVLLEEPKITLSGDALSGPASLQVGRGKQAIIEGNLRPQPPPGDGQLVFEVTRLQIEPRPSEHESAMSTEKKNPEDVVAEYEDANKKIYDESNDGSASTLDVIDEDWGIDDENADEEEPPPAQADDAPGDPPEPAPPSQESEPSDNLVEVEPLLGDIPIAISVELGRVRVSADEIIHLRPGHLIELGRAGSDPVDLVVAGKLVAQGELVEIDNALGVRILTLAKEKDA